jgi:hypothetical protein
VTANVSSAPTTTTRGTSSCSATSARWTIVYRTGQAESERILSERLARNGLTDAGTETLRITGAGRTASSLK